MKKKSSIMLAIMLTLVITAVGLYSMNKAYAVENDQIKPIHSYTFDNDNGSSVIDTGSMAGTEGKFNGVANGSQVINEDGITFRRFNGKSDYIQINNRIIPIGKKSIEFKIRKNGAPRDYEIILDNNGTNQYKSGFSTLLTKDGTIRFQALSGTPAIWDSVFAITSVKNVCDGEWHNILLTYDGTINNEDAVKLYVDDKLEASKSANNPETKSSYDYVVIGKNINSSIGNQYFKGDLSDIKIYSEVEDDTIQTESITLDKTAIDLLEGNADKLTATVLPENAVNKKVVWSSSDETIATVDEEGNVSAIKVGQADITAKVDGTNLSATCKVIVTEKEPEPQPTPGKAILSISLVDGKTKDYDISMEEVDKFINWYETKASSTYKFDKNISPYKSVKEYIVHDKITSFEVREYE
jgi:uncharacterized protein YjdB